MLEYKIRRKFVNRARGGYSRMLSIPPYFLDAMHALDAQEVIISLEDEDHMVLEIVRDKK